MSHHGDRIAALVDGELDHDSRDRLLAHIAQCGACRTEVEEQRRVKSRLAGLGPPGPTAEFERRLLTMAEPGPPIPPVRRPLPAARPPVSWSGFPQGYSSAVAHPERSRPAGFAMLAAHPRPRSYPLRVATAGMFGVAAAALAVAFVLGGSSDDGGEPVAPPVDRYAVEHTTTTGGFSLVEPPIGSLPGTFAGQPGEFPVTGAAQP